MLLNAGKAGTIDEQSDVGCVLERISNHHPVRCSARHVPFRAALEVDAVRGNAARVGIAVLAREHLGDRAVNVSISEGDEGGRDLENPETPS